MGRAPCLVVVYDHLTGSDFKKARPLTGKAGKLFANICKNIDKPPNYPFCKIPVFDFKAKDGDSLATFFTKNQSPYSLKVAPHFNGLYLKEQFHKPFKDFQYKIKSINPHNILALGEIAAWATTNVSEGSIKTRMGGNPYSFASVVDKTFYRVFVGPSLQGCYEDHPKGERNLKLLHVVMKNAFNAKAIKLEML